MRLILLLLITVGGCASAGHGAAGGPDRPPNIVLILADDAGYADFGFQAATDADLALLTPNIDRIAAGGARLDAFTMAGCVCSPSRAGLLTGRYPQRFGHERNIPPGYMESGLDLGQATVADRLRALGYRTACVGKWHLGYPDAYHPLERGFDHFYGCLQGSRSYLPIEDPSPHRVLLDDREPTPEGGYVTDRLGAAAVRFIEANVGRTFFLYLSFTAPHGPLEPRPGDLEALATIEKERRRKYAGLVKAMDDNVGRVLDALDRLGLARDTLVVFTNDNGGQTLTGAVNRPLRGRKGQLFEGGVRVPTAVRWPGRIAPGTVVSEPAIALDLLPTFVSAAGGRAASEWGLDGVDLLPRLLGGPALAERPLFWRSNGPEGPIAVRRGRWKLVWRRGVDEAPMLFDLATDRSEQMDLTAAYPQRVAELVALARGWEAGLEDPRWGG